MAIPARNDILLIQLAHYGKKYTKYSSYGESLTRTLPSHFDSFGFDLRGESIWDFRERTGIEPILLPVRRIG